MWWCALALAADLEWNSPAQPAPVHSEAPVFSGPLVDTGWWPSASDPLAVRFHITPSGSVFTDIDADSELAWPDPLFHRLMAIPETGSLAVDSDIEVAAELQIDIFGLYTGVVDLWTRNFNMRDAVSFDGLLLQGGPTRDVVLNAVGNGGESVDYSIQIFPGLDVVAVIDVYPEVEVVISEGRVQSQVGTTPILQDIEELWMAVPLEPTLPASLDTRMLWSAEMDALLNVVFEPSVELDTFVGGFTLFSFPLDVAVVDFLDRFEADPIEVAHPLPGMKEVEPLFAFGEVELGQERSLPVAIPNLGDLLLEGTVTVDGPGDFTVFPDSVVARSNETDGLTLTFRPTVEAPLAAELVFVTNDPLTPELRVPITGIGWVERVPEPDPEPTDTTPTDTDTDDGPGPTASVSAETKGCGCSASTGRAGMPLIALVGLLGLRRRRRG